MTAKILKSFYPLQKISIDSFLKPYDFVGIGAGPGNISAATYLASEGARTLLIENHRVGGHIADTPWLENLPGSEPQTGKVFQRKLIQSYLRFDHVNDGDHCVGFVKGEAVFITWKGTSRFRKIVLVEKPETGNHYPIHCNTVSIGTGLSWESVDFTHEINWNDLHYGPAKSMDMKEGTVGLILGGGNSSCQAASAIPHDVHVVMRSGFKASQFLIQRVESNPSVTVWGSHNIKRIIKLDDAEHKYLAILTCENGEESFGFDEMFYTAGSKPNSEIAKTSRIKTDSDDYVIIDEHFRTSFPGVFAIGDVIGTPRRLSIPIGHGAQVASETWNYLSTKS